MESIPFIHNYFLLHPITQPALHSPSHQKNGSYGILDLVILVLEFLQVFSLLYILIFCPKMYLNIVLTAWQEKCISYHFLSLINMLFPHLNWCMLICGVLPLLYPLMLFDTILFLLMISPSLLGFTCLNTNQTLLPSSHSLELWLKLSFLYPLKL